MTTSASSVGSDIAVGSNDGTVTWVSPTGSVDFQFTVGGLIVGIGSSARIEFAALASGTVEGSNPRTPTTRPGSRRPWAP